MTVSSFTDLNGEVRLVGTITPAGGELLDLGLVNVPSLMSGPRNLFTTTLNQFVSIEFGTAGYVAWDANYVQVGFAADNLLAFCRIASGSPLSAVGSSVQTQMRRGWAVRFAAALPVWLLTDTNAFWINGTMAAWVASHAYPAPALLPGSTEAGIDGTSGVIAVGHIWSSSGGTSAGSTPNFAGNIGGTVVDNDITWTDEGAVTTVGAIHLYAQVAG